MFMRLQKYNLSLNYIPGSKMYISDMLSRAYLQDRNQIEESVPQEYVFSAEMELYQDIENIDQASYMKLAEGTQEQIKSATKEIL